MLLKRVSGCWTGEGNPLGQRLRATPYWTGHSQHRQDRMKIITDIYQKRGNQIAERTFTRIATRMAFLAGQPAAFVVAGTSDRF